LKGHLPPDADMHRLAGHSTVCEQMQLSASMCKEALLVLIKTKWASCVTGKRTCGDERSDKDACDNPRNRCRGDALTGAAGTDHLHMLPRYSTQLCCPAQ